MVCQQSLQPMFVPMVFHPIKYYPADSPYIVKAFDPNRQISVSPESRLKSILILNRKSKAREFLKGQGSLLVNSCLWSLR
jgi:hypothetical protein